MTADLETIRRVLAHFENVSRTHTEKAGAADVLAALGRVEERERALTEALQKIGALSRFEDEHTASIYDLGAIARAALAGSVAGEEQDWGRASAASISRGRLAEGRAEE